MREEVRHKLDKVLKQQRRRRVFIFACIALFPLPALYLYQPPSERIVYDNAKLTWSTRRISHNGRAYAQILAKLKDGRVVQVYSRTKTLPPPVGSDIRIVEEKYWLGYSRFVWA